jgi:hypothetical protein
VKIAPEMARKFDLQPKQVTAALVGLKNRVAVFNVQRFVNDYAAEPLLAVLPGVALDELWAAVGLGEQALLAISGLVALVSLASLVAVVLAGLNERRRELAVLRAVGAGPRHVLVLLAAEGALVTLAGALLGAAVAALAVWGAGPWVQQQFGITLLPVGAHGGAVGAVRCRGAGGYACQPGAGWRAYRLSLADGLSPTNLMLLHAAPVACRLPAMLAAVDECRGRRPAQGGVPLMKPPLAATGRRRRPEPGTARTITWDALVPADWDPFKDFKGLNFQAWTTATRAPWPRCSSACARSGTTRRSTTAIVGQVVRIPGFVVPLEDSKEGLKEFLLVPYFGACIHSPPPPANQIIHVLPRTPGQGPALDGCGVDHRHAGHGAHRFLHGCGQLPHRSR